MNIIQLDQRPRRKKPQFLVLPIDSPPATKLLVAYSSLWQSNPLWLKNLHPSIPNPRKDPQGAIQAAWALLREAAQQSIAGQVAA